MPRTRWLPFLGSLLPLSGRFSAVSTTLVSSDPLKHRDAGLGGQTPQRLAKSTVFTHFAWPANGSCPRIQSSIFCKAAAAEDWMGLMIDVFTRFHLH
ncbi:hypothetical protein B0J18DRAFT_426578, partial [Chaetomium sp. MPI-SDFR-AT-0129]